MLPASRERILGRLVDTDVVLDIGGWADPFHRADWVMDVMPYETRGLYQREGWIAHGDPEPQRFTPETWIERDICDREPYPFADGAIDFVICSHTLEDVRDPVWVCSEMQRVGRAGYVEVPSRLEEQSYGVSGPFVGWPHHHWLVDVTDAGVEFTFKAHELHSRPGEHFPAEFWERLDAEERVQMLWWEGGFAHRERILIAEPDRAADLSGFVRRELAARGLPPPPDGGRAVDLRRRIGRRLRGSGPAA